MAPMALALILVLGTVGARKCTRGLKGSSQVLLGPVAFLDGLWAQAPALVVDLDQLALAVRASVIRGRPFQVVPSLMLFLASV